jgi:ADP-ribose pyrophosphatase
MSLSKPARLARRVIYQNPWVNLYVDKVQFPNGRLIEQHHLLDFDTHGVAAVVENDQAEILFVKVCRYTTGLTSWEIPAGCIELGEDVLTAARREVLEETGHQTSDHQLLYSFYPMDGIANKLFYVVRCRAGHRSPEYDRQEIDAVRWFTRRDVGEMIAQKSIHDGFSLTALLLALADGRPAASQGVKND